MIILALNLVLMFISWFFFKFPHGDEYLILFMIPLIFFIAPFFLKIREMSVLFAVNLAFFVFYYCVGALNVIDIVVLMTLLGAVSGGSYLVKFLNYSFESFQNLDIYKLQYEYNKFLNELENINRRGRKVENELMRISRLYEVTKKLVPSLKFDDLVKELFDFLENNFSIKKMHMMVFDNGKFIYETSKSTGYDDLLKESKESLNSKKIISIAKKNDFNPFILEKEENSDVFNEIKTKSDIFMVFPLFIGDKLFAVLAIEGAYKASFDRFRILIPQIALELRKVELYEKIQKLSIIDGLTEVYLRRYLMDRLEEEVDRANRLGLTFSIGMVDIDHFKKCNDKWGHLVGDSVLKKIAERLKKSVREVDMIARYGGEEFCIVLPDTNKKLAKSVAERLRGSIEANEIKAFDVNVKITTSVGIATFPEDGKSVSVLIEKADAALYTAKRRGRNTVCVA